MNRQHLVVGLVAVLVAVGAFFVGRAGRLVTTVTNMVDREKPWPISDLVADRNYRYYDWHTCQSTDGQLLADWHFTGKDRSLRNQLTPRGVQVVNDSSLPRGYMRIRRYAQEIVEGHMYGGNLTVEFNGPVRPLYPVEACGPERGHPPDTPI